MKGISQLTHIYSKFLLNDFQYFKYPTGTFNDQKKFTLPGYFINLLVHFITFLFIHKFCKLPILISTKMERNLIYQYQVESSLVYLYIYNVN